MTDTEGEEPEYERLLPEEPKKRIPTPPPTLPVLLTELFTSSIGCFAFVIFLLTCMSYLILQYKCFIPYRPYGAYVIVEMIYLILALLFSYFLLFHLDSFTTKLRSSGTIAIFVVIYLLSFMMLPIMGWMLFAGAFTPLNQMRVTAGTNNTPVITPRCPNLDSSIHETLALLLNITHSSLVILFCFGCCHIHKPKEYTPAIEPIHQESSDDESEIQRHVRIRTSSHVVPIEESISRQASIAANKGRSASVVNLMAPVFGTATDLSTTTASSISIHPEPLPHIHSRHQSLTTASPIIHQRSSIGSKSAPMSRQSSVGTTSAPISRLSSISVILQQHQQSQSQAMPLPHPSTLQRDDESPSPPDSPPRRQQSIVRASSAYDFTPTIKAETAEPVL